MPVLKKGGSKKKRAATQKRKKTQKMYNMKGCSKTKCVKRKKRYLGLKGGSSAAYPLMTQPPQHNFLNSLQGGGCGSCGMTGGSGCTSCGIQGGGTCAECGLVGGCKNCGKNKKGGNPFVGKTWEPNDVNSWPGVDGSAHGGNHYDLNNYKVDPQTAMIVGGKKRGKTYKVKQQRGAGISNLFQQDLTNMMRQVTTGFGSAYNTLNGFPPPVSPMPTEGQLIKR